MIYIIASLAVVIGGLFIIYLFKPKKKKRTDSIYTNALNAMVRGDTRIALNHLRDVVKQDSDHINAYLQMGNILRQDNNEQAAIKIHQSLMVRPNLNNEIKLDIHKALALDFEQINDLSRSQQEAELVLKIDKRNQWANEFLLMIFEKQKDWDKVTQISKILQRLNKEKDPAQISKFLVFQGMDKLEKGLEIYGQLPSYRAMLDREGVDSPADLALIGDEDALRTNLLSIESSGVTDFNAAIMDIEPGAFERTFDFVASLKS